MKNLTGYQITPRDLLWLKARAECKSNKEAGERFGVSEGTFSSHMSRLAARGVRLPVIGQDIGGEELETRSVPIKITDNKHAFYIITAAQYNTAVDQKFFQAIGNYLKNVSKKFHTRLIVCPFEYNNFNKIDKFYMADEIKDFVVDYNLQLGNSLFLCSDYQPIATAANPLLNVHKLNGTADNIVPHATIEINSTPVMYEEPVGRIHFTTGCITKPRYPKKSAIRIKAEMHTIGALLVEVTDNGTHYIQVLEADDNKGFSCLDPYGKVIYVDSEGVHEQNIAAINWGDIHADEIKDETLKISWTGKNNLMDYLKPDVQVFNDLYSHHTQSHHDKSYESMLAKFHGRREGCVQTELENTAKFLDVSSRSYCTSAVVHSNHDRHLDKWVEYFKPELDLQNAQIYYELKLEQIKAIKRGDKSFNMLEYALRNLTQTGILGNTVFLEPNKSARLPGDLEVGLHGDIGLNGAKGSTQSYTYFNISMNKGHDHTLRKKGKVWSAGAMRINFPYMNGGHSHSISNIITYPNGKRSVLTLRNGKYFGNQ